MMPLIEPYGIEMKMVFVWLFVLLFPLIEPYGIEIEISQISVIEAHTFNRTLWN